MSTRTPLPDHPDLTLIRGRRGHDVVRVQTPSGVVGYIAADIPPEVLEAFGKKLARKLARTNRRLAAQLLK
jgi:predicted DNA-binding transcriptional regulator